ncbi:hypothetical protein Q1695_002303 [Nippostrongylus brasiliensis]|nr:hypothetical protein Q1695_002303 [Nippostrongylus brasiliensis]
MSGTRKKGPDRVSRAPPSDQSTAAPRQTSHVSTDSTRSRPEAPIVIAAGPSNIHAALAGADSRQPGGAERRC